ncbi:unnamed protein product [Didymodactylos carnosus]|uniref:Uncharacterized protein n=1 Tax=Didymodactylos carnosus TaxID=1234261 RepID=A0A814DLC7_9BILA|nr:unnamed protein product [Didymodactylos carnosus]CAF0957118.1 unnamed protein product [Didymodactylos carnosus]CAF3721882.1 unnamed protein product [Didymodactylos carnosus]CAF3732048.1 unnamed protein product [Didymodactylos carnosus]
MRLLLFIYFQALIIINFTHEWSDSGKVMQNDNLQLKNSLLQKITQVSNMTRLKKKKRTTTSASFTMTTVSHDPIYEHAYYKSSWGFLNKHTVRVTFQLFGSLQPKSSDYMKYIARHIHSGTLREYSIQPYKSNKNNTNTIHLQDIEHGKHSICLLIYASRSLNSVDKQLAKEPKNIFCQDIYFNYHRYGHLEHTGAGDANAVFFMITQYAIVSVILFILQIAYSIQKYRKLKTMHHHIFPKLKHAISSESFETHKKGMLRMFQAILTHKQPIIQRGVRDYDTGKHQLRQQIVKDVGNKTMPSKRVRDISVYDASKTTLLPNKRLYVVPDTKDPSSKTTWTKMNINSSSEKHYTPAYKTHLLLPSPYSSYSNSSSLSQQPYEHDDDDDNAVTFEVGDTSGIEDENGFHSNIVSYDEQTPSFQSMAHILDASKPWSPRLSLVPKKANGDHK